MPVNQNLSNHDDQDDDQTIEEMSEGNENYKHPAWRAGKRARLRNMIGFGFCIWLVEKVDLVFSQS